MSARADQLPAADQEPGADANGLYDFFFPSETAQRPFFNVIGTPATTKRWILYEGGHDVPRTDLIRESLAWLDKYLGAVK